MAETGQEERLHNELMLSYSIHFLLYRSFNTFWLTHHYHHFADDIHEQFWISRLNNIEACNEYWATVGFGGSLATIGDPGTYTNRMAWQWAETLVEIRGTLVEIRGTTKLGCRCNFPKHEFNRPVCLEAHHYLLAHLSQEWFSPYLQRQM